VLYDVVVDKPYSPVVLIIKKKVAHNFRRPMMFAVNRNYQGFKVFLKRVLVGNPVDEI
jgi:hypothetical protein